MPEHEHKRRKRTEKANNAYFARQDKIAKLLEETDELLERLGAQEHKILYTTSQAMHLCFLTAF